MCVIPKINFAYAYASIEGLQPAITSEPSNPSTVVEGQNLTLQWSYNLDGQSIIVIRVVSVTDDTTKKIAERIGDNNAVVQVGYENQFRATISETQATLTILAVPRSFNKEQYRLLIVVDATLQSNDVEISVLGKYTISIEK